MPDNFGQTLKEGSTRFADTVNPGPVGNVRARGDQRRRRTAAAASVAVAAVIIAAGAGGVYALGQSGGGNPAPVTSVTTPAPTSSPTGSPSSTPTIRPTLGGGSTRTASPPASRTAPASTAASGYSELAGQWKQTDGAGEALYVFPDGVIGFGEASGAYYPLCAGELRPAVNGVHPATYPFTAACGPATSGTMTFAEGTLTIHIPGDTGPADTWVPVEDTGPTSLPPSWLFLGGTWTITAGDGGDESFTVAKSGAVTWSLVTQQGQTVRGAGTLQVVAGGGYRIATSFGSPSVAGVWPIVHEADGQAIVIGGMGALDFHRTSAG
jgi:hypothetical protein